ncbi:MAG: fibronectin type III domain-containing protein, partial [Planctomycetaceae bacterium]
MSVNVPPKDLKQVSVQARQAALSWTHPRVGITGFRLMVSLDKGLTWAEQARLPVVTSHTVTNLIPGQTYWFRIQAVHAPTNRESAFSNPPLPVITPQVPPTAPTNVRVTSPTSTGGVVQWTDVSDNEHLFEVQASTDNGKNWKNVATTAINATSTPLTNLLPSTSYQIRVVVRNNVGFANSNPCPYTTPATPPQPPATPTQLSSANVTTSGFDLTWSDQSPNELGFVVQLSRDLGQTWSNAAETGANVTRQSLTGLASETPYRVRVLARNNAGLSAPSEVLAVETLGVAPAAPDQLRALADTLTATSVELAWRDTSANEQEFVIRSQPAGSTRWEPVGVTAANVTTFQVTGLAPSTSYQFSVCARNRHGVSADSAPVAVSTRGLPPNRPEKLRIENVRPRLLDLAWNDCSNNEHEFLVVCSTNDGPFVPVGLAAKDSPRLTVCDLQPLTRYCFQVKARNTDGDSDFTPATCVQTPGEAPSPPTRFELTGSTATSASLAWVDNSPNEVDFALFVSLDQGLNYSHLTTFPANSTRGDLSALKSNQRYLLKLQARNSWGGSPFAGPLDFTTQLAPPAAPQRLQAVAVGPERIDLAWVLEDTTATSLLVDLSEDQGLTWQFKVSMPGHYRQCGILWINSGTTYAFRIRATNAAGESPWSNVASASTPVIRPTRPENLVAENPTATTIDLRWTDTARNETDFLVQVLERSGASWATAGVTSANITRFQARGLTPRTEYQFRVLACNSAGCSEPSSPVSLSTLPP